ncbi:MAG: trypsin-like peptidase domain-containing protein [Burkholderiales bacterium]|nr:trypsin-like peptidase domain-containing protein [Burkholderiales bacterium]
MRKPGLVQSLAISILILATGATASYAQQEPGAAASESGSGSGTRASDNPIGSLFRGIGNVLTSIVSPKASEIRRQIEAGQIVQAARAAEADPNVLEGASGAELKALIVKSLNTKLAPELSDALLQIQRANFSPELPATWAGPTTAIRNAESVSKNYDSFGVLSRADDRLPQRAQLATALKDLIDVCEAKSQIALLATLNQQSSRELIGYPVPINKSRVLAASKEKVREVLATLPAQRLAQFWKDLGNELAIEEKRWFAELYLGKTLGDRVAASASFKEVSTTLREVKELSLPVPESPIEGLALIHLPPTKGAQQEFAVNFQSDLPLVLKVAADAPMESTLGPSNARYVLAVRVKSARAIRKVPEKQEVSSKFESGSRQVPNPAYEQARINYVSAEADFTRQKIQNASTPTYGVLGAVAKALSEGAAAVVRNRAAEALAATPSMLTEPVYTSYNLTVSKVDSIRETQIEIFLVDRATQKYTRFVQPIQETKRYDLAYNIHEKDADGHRGSSRYANEEDMAKFEQAPHVIPVSALFATAEAPTATVVAKEYASEAVLIRDIDSTEAGTITVALQSPAGGAPSAGGPVKDDPRMNSVVVVKSPKGALGAGFFVGPDLVITNAHVMDGEKFAEIKMYGGKDAFGKLLKADVSMDLALIRVSEKGAPIRFVDEQVTVGSTVEAIGHPRGLEFSLTRGIVSGVRKRAVLGGKDVVLIQTDAAISPGNSGGPLYLGERVLGINTLKFTGRGAEGLGFAVHAAEIQRFIATD